jgi:hypothetical protein
VSVKSVMDFMRCSFVTDKDQLIHLSGSFINCQNDSGALRQDIYYTLSHIHYSGPLSFKNLFAVFPQPFAT